MTETTDKPERLLNIAESLFAEHGFDGTSIRMIAEAADMNVAMISYYFGSKEKMFEELINRRTIRMAGWLEQIHQNTEITPWQKMELLIDNYVERIMTNSSYHKLMMRELSLRTRPEIVSCIEDRLGHNMRMMKEIMEEGIAEGEFRNDIDFTFMMTVLFGTITHAMNADKMHKRFMLIENRPPSSDHEVRDRASTLLKTLIARYLLTHPEKYNYQ